MGEECVHTFIDECNLLKYNGLDFRVILKALKMKAQSATLPLLMEHTVAPYN